MFKVEIQGSKVKRIRPHHGCSISNISDFTCVSSPFLWLSMVSYMITWRRYKYLRHSPGGEWYHLATVLCRVSWIRERTCEGCCWSTMCPQKMSLYRKLNVIIIHLQLASNYLWVPGSFSSFFPLKLCVRLLKKITRIIRKFLKIYELLLWLSGHNKKPKWDFSHTEWFNVDFIFVLV